jgi:c(7)-type cytochrome triheme protein
MKLRLIFGALVLAASAAHGADLPNGKAIYEGTCFACHNSGVAGSPKLGDAAAWAPRIKNGPAALYSSAANGKGAMPARGGNAALTEAQLNAAVNYMILQASPDKAAKAAPAAAAAKVASAANAPAAVAAAPKPAPTVAAPPAPVVPNVASVTPGGGNPFNRLMKPPAQRNLPPPEDGIHDPSNDGTHALQPPLVAFATLPKSNDGNRIDWVKAINENAITPRFDRNDPSAQPMVMDLNIVREVKGSMPDVVYPHKQHTQWLDCSNCHPAIFVPQKGANQISMAAILMGQKCGVCHGKVAFPVSECRRCHSKSKAPPAPVAAAGTKP